MMSRQIGMLLFVALLTVAGCMFTENSIDGWYLNEHRDVYSRVHVASKDSEVTVRLIGGHIGNGPTLMVSNDCEIIATGKLEGNKLVAQHHGTPGDVYPEVLFVTIEFSDGELEVLGASPKYCGWYTRFYGTYQKMTPKQIGELYTSEGIEIPDELKE